MQIPSSRPGGRVLGRPLAPVSLLCVVSLLTLGVPRAGASLPGLDVSYRSATTVYLAGGQLDGLAVGDRLQVMDGRKVVAELEVVYAADHSAATRIVSEGRTVRVGDTALRPGTAILVSDKVASAPAPAPATTSAPAAPDEPAKPWAHARGGIAFGYYGMVDKTASKLNFQQSTVRGDLGLSDLFGQPLSLNVRMTSSHDWRERALGAFAARSESNNRLYEAALRYEPPSGKLAVEAGRIGVSYFAGIGYLDGVAVRVLTVPRLQVGGFVGRTADIYGLGFEGGGLKYGALLRLLPARSSNTRFDSQLALVHEGAAGSDSRDYVSLESRLQTSTRFSFFERAEIDWNRGWRASLAPSEFQLSNLSLSANWRVSTLSSLTVFYDARRNYRTYLTRQTPAEYFDTLLHQGLGTTLMLVRPSGLRMSIGGTLRTVQHQPNAYSATLGLAHDRLFSGHASLGLDASGYRNEYTEGYLVVARAGQHLTNRVSLDLSGGASRYRLRLGGTRFSSDWLQLAARGELGHGLYLLGNADYYFGDDARGPRSYFEVGYRFR